MVARVALVVVIAVATARAQPPGQAVDASAQLREANAAATAGDWKTVASTVGPLLKVSLVQADLTEAHRLYGLAAFFQGFTDTAEHELLEYLKADPDGHLDPTLYPPEAIAYLAKVRSDHEAEILRARQAKTPQRRSGWVSWIPIISQIQNKQNGKAIAFAVTGVVLGATDIITYVVLKDYWCKNGNLQCDSNGGTTSKAKIVQGVNYATQFALPLLAVCAGVDGVLNYLRLRRRESIHAYVSPVSSGALVGISTTW